jgi:hypothetical protein
MSPIAAFINKRAIASINVRATHNFMSRQALQIEDFEGFDVTVVDGHTVLDRVLDLEIKLGNYTMRDTFYVVDLSDIDVVLGVQCLITLGKITTNYQTLEMGFKDSEGKRIVMRGMSTMSTLDNFDQEDGEDLQVWGCNVCCRVLDHYIEGFIWSSTISYRDQDLVGATSTGFWSDSTRETP